MAEMGPALDHLERIASLAEEAGLPSLCSELRDERIPALRDGSLSVVLLGEFNHGKSTLINALLGDDVVPMGITPTTAVITRITHGESHSARVILDDADPRDVDIDALDELVREENDRVRHVEVRYPATLLAEQVVIVDTPGVNDISQQKVEVTYGIVPRADVIVFVLDATQVLKRTELRFIEQRLLSGLRERLMFVLGKVDRLDAEEAEEVERYARERLESLLGPVELFPLSARNAMKSGNAGFDRFRDHLTDFLQRRRDTILLDSAISTGLRSASALLGNIQIKRRSYQLEQGDLESRVATVQEKLSESRRAISQNVSQIDETATNLAATARHNLAEFRDAFLAALPREIEKVSAKDIPIYLPGFIEDTFRAFLEREGRSLARGLEHLAEEIIAVTNENLRQAVDALKDELGLDPDALDFSIDSTAYDVGVFAMGAFGVSVLVFINAIVGGLIALATPVVAYVLKDRLDARMKQKATAAGLETITTAAEHAEVELVKMVEDFSTRLKQFVEDAGDRLYRQIDDALHTVLEEKKRAGSDTDTLDASAATLEVAARDELLELQQMRKALWGA